MRNPSHLVNENSSTIYVNVGSSTIVPVSVDPNETGLFGSSLSLASRIMLGDHPETGFRFKASYHEDPWRMINEGEPYDYINDLEYRTIVRDLIENSYGRRQGNWAFLIKMWNARLTLLPEFVADLYHGSRPQQAPRPEEHDHIGYVWPSYIIWENDSSYTSFVGSPDRLELPKNVLRETRGHPPSDELSGSPIFHERYLTWNRKRKTRSGALRAIAQMEAR